MAEYRKVLWTELIAFDNRDPDCGAERYLGDLGFRPDAVSLFLWGCDFVHLHDGLAEDAEFPPDIGCYLDIYMTEPKHTGPAWRKFQLRRLVAELRGRGVEVYFSIFPCSLGSRFHAEWVAGHPEVAAVAVRELQAGLGEGFPPPVINPLKRLADGSFYEDFLLDRVAAVLDDYGFDGWHLADGYNHPWYQLCHADYSDDMVDQYLADGGPALPPEIPPCCGGDRDRLERRAQYLWRERQNEWIGFNRRRNERFLAKAVNRLHAMGKKAACNTSWTRDPVEAIYRYGIDYRRLAAIGFDYLAIESCGAGGDLLDHRFRAHYPTGFIPVIESTILLTKAAAPEASFLFNNCTQDLTEGWSCLRHAPPMLEREIFTYVNKFYRDSDGAFRRATSGLQVCLAADIAPWEWRWLHAKWELAFADAVPGPGSIVLLYPEAMVEAELSQYLKHSTAHAAQLLAELLERGVPVAAATASASAEDRPLLAIHPQLLAPELRRELQRPRANPVLLLGLLGGDFADAPVRIDSGDFSFALYPGAAAVQPLRRDFPPPAEEAAPPEPLTFFRPLHHRPVAADFLDQCAQLMRLAAPPPVRPMEDPERIPDVLGFRFSTLELPGGQWRLLAGNATFRYIYGALETEFPAEKFTVANGTQARPVIVEPHPEGPDKSCFYLRVPPQGVAVVDITNRKDLHELPKR